MRKLIIAVLLLGAAGGSYIYFINTNLRDSLMGFGPAKTPDECVTRFRKAIKDRKYDLAAKYVSDEYAEQLKKAAEAAKELGEALDNLTYRMEKAGVATNEAKLLAYLFDPFPTNAEINLDKTGEKEAILDLKITMPSVGTLKDSSQFNSNNLDGRMMGALYRNNNSLNLGVMATFNYNAKAKIIPQGEKEHWKIQYTVNSEMRTRVDFLIANYKEYVNIFKKLSQELKNDPGTKENLNGELSKLLSEVKRSS
jgi:rRNA-processing protein FCF1